MIGQKDVRFGGVSVVVLDAVDIAMVAAADLSDVWWTTTSFDASSSFASW